MASQSASTFSTGAPPVEADGFAFSSGQFLAISGPHRHRRATARELETHFENGTDKSQPAHWFEAQLLHYGLEISGTKSVARARIFDAVQNDTLTVPPSISKLETKLKREWNVKNREANKARCESITKPEPKRAAGIKRKVEVEDAAAGSTASSSRNGEKKVRTETARKKGRKMERKEKGSAESPVVIEDKEPPATPIRQTSGRGTTAQGPTPSTVTAVSSHSTSSSGARAIRRPFLSTPANARRQMPTPPTQRQYHRRSFNGPDLDQFETLEEMDMGYQMAGMDPPASAVSWPHPPARLGRLGLLNGRYSVDSVLGGLLWPESRSDFHIIFTLSGSILWGRLRLGGIQGVLRIAERPQYAANRAITFRWRGESDKHEEFDEFEPMHRGESQVLTGDGHRGHIKFLGNGRIEARLGFMKLTFGGQRLDGQGTRSEISASEMEEEWDKYDGQGGADVVEENYYEGWE